MLERYEPGVKAVFSRNPTYHARDLPYLDKVEWLFIKDRFMQLALFGAGQVDLPYHDARVPRSEVSALQRASPGFPVASWDGLAVRSLAMRTDRPPFNDVRVRRALSLAVNRKTWVAEHLDGEGAEDHGPVPSAMRQWTLAARQLGEGRPLSRARSGPRPEAARRSRLCRRPQGQVHELAGLRARVRGGPRAPRP
jgi:peptide/nickel transport system substrate-binding protein